MNGKKKDIPGTGDNKKESMIFEVIRDGYNLPDAYFDTVIKKAVVKKDIITVLSLVQLTGDRFKDFYAETDEVRESDITASLERLLKNPLTPYSKLFFSGFIGSGKTTELIKLYFKLQKDFKTTIFSAWNKLENGMLIIENLLDLIMEEILIFLKLNDKTDGLNVLLKDIEEHKDYTLSHKCNKVLDYLKQTTGKEMLIIIDDLEKMRFVKVLEFYKKNSPILRDIHCKMVLTIPVELVSHPDFAVIESILGEAHMLPAIKIKDAAGNVHEPGIETLTGILERRVDLSLFEKQCYKEAVKYSGGSVRQLFSIVQRAALIEQSEIITEESMRRSVNHYKSTFSSVIRARDDEIKVTFEEYLEVLFDIYDGNKIAPVKNLALSDLISLGVVIKYNPGYYDVHPLLEDFIRAYKKNGEEKKSSAGVHKDIENGYLSEVEISNFFCIDELRLDNLQDKKEIYIIGENGDGKTILLEGILLALKGNRNVGEIVNFIKQNPRTGYYLKALDDNSLEYLFSEQNPVREYIAKNVFAYGVHRGRNDSDKADEYGYLTLFREDQYLKNPVKWLQYLHHKEKADGKPPIRLNTAIDMLRSLLNQNVEIDVTPDAVTFSERETPVEFSQLADGYKSVIVWTCDLLEKLSKNQPGATCTEDFKGIVLLDEIELFLHPKWKYKIVRNLRHWFPGIQFIFTTHSTTVIQGASKDAVFYRLYKEDGVTKVSQPVSNISNLMLNAIVTSPLFGLESAKAFGFEQDVPEQLESTVFKDKILNKITAKEDKTFILDVYRKSKKDTGGETYILKDDLDYKETDRLLRILIDTGYKDKLDTSSDFLYFKIHREIENRIKTMTGVTEDRVMDMVKDELDKYEDSLKHV